MKDATILAGLVVSFTALVLAHLGAVFRLLGGSPRWHGAVALVLAPLAPYWAWRRAWRGLAATWVASGAAYLVFDGLSRR